MKKLVFLIALLIIGSVGATSIDYQIIGNRVLVEADFDKIQDFELRLPHDVSIFETDSKYEIINMEEYKLLKVIRSDDLRFSYITDSMIDISRDKSFFIMRNYFPQKADITLFLPEAGVLMTDGSLIFPNADQITTDGRRVILKWKDFEKEEIVVAYEKVEEKGFWFYVLIILIAAFIIFYVFQLRRLKRQIKKWQEKTKKTKKKSRERKKKSVTKNLFGEEKKIIEYLINKKGHESWTKEIVRDLGISKVRLSRRLRSLEQKELISKEPYGNENRIKLLKTS